MIGWCIKMFRTGTPSAHILLVTLNVSRSTKQLYVFFLNICNFYYHDWHWLSYLCTSALLFSGSYLVMVLMELAIPIQ